MQKISSNRSFGVVFFVVLLLIALYPLINDGEVITYSTDGTPIGGLDTSIRYRIIKLDFSNYG